MNPIDVSQLLSALPVPVALVDVSGRITLANSAWGAAFDCEVDRIRGIPLAEHLLLRDPSKLKHALGKLSARRATQLQLDCELAKSLQQGIAGGEGGSWVELNLRRFDLLGESPDATQPMIAVSVLDVSEARTLSLQAAQAEARLASLTDQIKVGIVILHANDELLLINHSAAAFLGVNQAGPSLPGLSRDEFLMQASLLAVGERNVLANAQPDSNHQLRLKAPVAGASSLDIKCVSVVVDGESGGTLWMVEPVDSEGKSLAATSSDSGPLVEMIGQELAVVVEGATAAVIRAEQIEVDESLVSVLSRIRVAAEAAYTGIAGLVDMSNPRRAVGEGINTEFKLRHFVASLISQVVHMAEENNVRLRVRIEQDVAEQLQGDIVRLRHGLKTLLECMLQIAPNEVTLAIEAEYFNESSMTARFSVVAANDRALTGKAGPTRPQTPTQNPVRLAIAKYAIAALGSELQRESSSVGTLTHGFSMTLQLSKKASDQPRMQYVSLNGMPVLIVSANAKQRLQLSNWLKTMRMLPLEADNAAMALALLTRLYEEGSPVPLVILENQLPVQDGFLLSFRIKFDDRLSATHIIMLTNQGKRGDALACKENGVAGYLPQPVGKSRLTDAIMAVTGASDDATQEPALQAKLVTRHSLHDQRKGATVLLIDNDPLMLEITEITLRKHDAALVIAASREEALTMAASDIYDMILVSVDLPDLSPENFVRSVKERLVKDADSTPVIAISKINRPTVEQQCLIWGFTGIMFKPVERDELIALITKVNRLKRLAREQAAQTAA